MHKWKAPRPQVGEGARGAKSYASQAASTGDRGGDATREACIVRVVRSVEDLRTRVWVAPDSRCFRSITRARWMRERTVPMAHCITSAIS